MKTSVVMVAVEVVDLDGVLDADGGDDAKDAMGFSCQKILDLLVPEDTGLSRARRYWTFLCQKILDLIDAIQNSSHSSTFLTPQSLSVSSPT